MGRKVTDGKAINRTVPAGKAVVDGELYRIGGVNGLSIGVVAVGDTARTLAFECDTNAIYSIHLPDAVNPARGDFLYWADPTLTFQDGAVDLLAAPHVWNQAPCFWVTEVRSADPDGGYVVRGRIINGVPGDSKS